MLNIFSLALGLFSLFVTGCSAVTSVTVSAAPSHDIPPTLWGQMFEDISSGDGGLYAELLQNRAFQMVTPNTTDALNAWAPVNGASITVIADSIPVSTALPNALQVTIPGGQTGPVGFGNSGYFGINVNASWTYKASFYYRFPTASSFRGNLTIGLQTSTGQMLAAAPAGISGAQTTWQQVNVSFTPTTTPSTTANNFTITIDGMAGAGQKINFAMLSLFPPTFKNRPNGMRVDIATALAEMGPSFFRLPGGNNLGQTAATRWQWNNTVGALVDRPGRVGDWGYVNTDGLGLFEYLEWCEDLGMQPIMAVWSGYALGDVSVTEAQLPPYIQQAADQINFVVGDPATSAPAALRASLGHPEPFVLNYVEIGNEDFIAHAPSTYTYRWHDFVTTLSAEFPDIQFIATTRLFNPILSPNPLQYDAHVYQTPTWFAQNSFLYDSLERNATRYFEGEYAAISTNANDIFGTTADGRLTYPTMQASVGEAAFMTGLERNSDIVFAASYAPLLNHVVDSQWTPNLISFDACAVCRSTSFYVQKLFSLNRGLRYLPSTLPTPTGTLFWSVTDDTTAGEVIIKVSNTIGTSQIISFSLPFTLVASTGTAQVLTGAETASNTPANPNLIVPITQTITTGKVFNYTAAGFSVSVLTIGVE